MVANTPLTSSPDVLTSHTYIYDSMIFPHLCSDVDQGTSRLLTVDIFNNIIYCRPGDRSTVDS